MKQLLTILLAGVSTLAIAQKKNQLSKCNDDNDGKVVVRPPAPPTPVEPLEPVIYSSSDARGHIWFSDDHQEKTSTIHAENGVTKLVRYNSESGELFLKYKFNKRNEEFIYEKTVNAADKSEEERQDIIDDFEIEIELPGRGI
ncbi:DUF1129 domain-containing protein [Dyadobacter sp. CY347]|uniref:DUF1129 domain-containing protein n=1 Tax=Dyadobacter sp. CY347 TaxID=2909336 RepID=UPI001F42EC0B|nr:DUF1129 domain-containing protein [Dyadobacter sp. CY347]MCF2488286.1 DUF1129 domain-containing protein [Dyadobacter sp. CY347]